ncbi:MAG: M28 family peptidase, partial [Flavobacteriales bacterium]|nr:M28 family peptidase [Flavobacteriales bacterium]
FTMKISLHIDKPTKELTSENVLAYIPGKELKDELIVITAHYDHIGKEGDVVFNGADDDGTGTVSLLELAEAFQIAIKKGFHPKRSILIMPVSGEEKGLLGSKYYTNNPIFPLENTVANLNIDMIGRYDEHHLKDSNYVYLIGSDKLSKELHELSEKVNNLYTKIGLDYKFNEENDPNRFYYRSDHYNFAKNNIPVIFYFSGVHEDYHKSTDTVEKIDYKKTEKIARLVFMTAWELANRKERIKLD